VNEPLVLADNYGVEMTSPPSTLSSASPANPWQGFGATVAVLILTGVILMLVSHRFARQEVEFNNSQNTQPRISHVRPADGETDVLPDEAISMDLRLPGKTEADAKLAGADPLTLSGVRLTTARGEVVDAAPAVSAAGDAITISPKSPLAAGTTYRIEVTADLRDTAGRPFKEFTSIFTTARNVQAKSIPLSFEQVPQKVEPQPYLVLTFGPDAKLYGGTFTGEIVRFDLNAQGTIVGQSSIKTLQAKGPRMITGLLFDPQSTADNLRLYVSHGQMVLPDATGTIQGADDFTGAITLLTGSQLDTAQDLVVGLPRGYKDHLNFQLTFGRDGAIYFNQGSHTSVGSPDNKWGQRPERLLTAAILRLDPTLIKNPPIDVRTKDAGRTDGIFYDPFAKDAPLTIYATGVRSAYKLLLHSNGNLYAPVNGAAAGGNLPERPANPDRPQPYRAMLNRIDELDHTTDDTLVIVKPGKYYGHPNPRRDQYILMGGNPTEKTDPYEVEQYPVKTPPEQDFEMPVLSFGKNRSVNSLVEYNTPSLDRTLRGAMIGTRFSAGSDLIMIVPDADGSIQRVVTKIDGFSGFSQPLDIAMHPKLGLLYVSEFGQDGSRSPITVLRPRSGAMSNAIERVVE
jgi:Bacterial Ig-like domain